MSGSNPLERCLLHEHDAMNTTFTLRVLDMNEHDARGLAWQCFDRIDALEGKLSRFIEGSDISRINAMKAGETLYLNEDSHACLLLAMKAAAATHGLFDVTQGARIQHRKDGLSGNEPEVCGRLLVHPDNPAVTCEVAGRQIDLGGIGKGFALDCLREILEQWKVSAALVCAGASSMLGYGPVAWPVEFPGSQQRVRLDLISGGLSASGVEMQGSHLVHPWGDEAMPARPCERVWVVADDAASAEVWSTALMLLDPVEMPEALEGVAGLREVHIQRDGAIERVL
ncbi:MAG TPA: FAD:protein FMN transferase [Luteolibacter sp.]|nr:FAD:protein FMN transferase [Luteolibacter sp.]